jgi:hypothetical protein
MLITVNRGMHLKHDAQIVRVRNRGIGPDLHKQRGIRMKRPPERRSHSLFFLPIIIVFALAGCVVHSISPFYTPDVVIEMPDIYGQWMLRESVFKEGTGKPWTFSKDSIIIPGDKGLPDMLSARFFKVNDTIFLDTVAAEPREDVSLWWTLHISPMHTVSKVVAGEDTLRIIPLNASWLEEAVKNRMFVVAHVWHEEQKTYLFTASSAEWAEFLKKYGSDPRAFPETDAFVFERHSRK